MSSKNIIISLFDHSGTWSIPYAKAGYHVVKVDLCHGINILKWDFTTVNKGSVRGVLAAPPCTAFSKASSMYWDWYDEIGFTAYSCLLVQQALNIIGYHQPDFWALENPTGRIERMCPGLRGKRLLSFQPFHFGDPFHKPTLLWGYFNPLMVRSYVKPEYYVQQDKGRKSIDKYWKPLYPNFSRQQLRSITPPGFAHAFYRANP